MGATMITYDERCDAVDWVALNQGLSEDHFNNGRTAQQLRQSFENSYVCCFAHAPDGRTVGTARALSDGIGNAYVVDVWTSTPFRRQGIAREMMRRILERLPGQHVCLFSMDEGTALYEQLGFVRDETGMALVMGSYLVNDSRTE